MKVPWGAHGDRQKAMNPGVSVAGNKFNVQVWEKPDNNQRIEQVHHYHQFALFEMALIRTAESR